MREVKFRVFLDGTEYDSGHPDAGIKRMLSWEDICDGTDCIDYYLKNEIAGCSVPMQFTGLKDVNNKEIYEGDILKIETSSEDEFGGDILGEDRYTVIFGDGAFLRDNGDMIFDYCTNSEIIGNIHENAGLLVVR